MEYIAIHTNQTSYVMAVLPSGHLEHVHYGQKIQIFEEKGLVESSAFIPNHHLVSYKEHPTISLEYRSLETSTVGKGDIRYPMVQLEFENTTYVSDFLFSHSISYPGKNPLKTLPSSYGEEEEIVTTEVILKEATKEIYLILYYHAFLHSDVIVKSAKLLNQSHETIRIKHLFSSQLDFYDSDFDIITLDGHWARERFAHRRSLGYGRSLVESMSGSSSNRQNPAFFLARKQTNEHVGEVYGFNLIYSGSFMGSIEVNSYEKTRVLHGIHPHNFTWILEHGEEFESCEAMLTYSDSGMNTCSQQFHRFINHHIVRGYWKQRPRPIVYNNWEATYFNFNERKILDLAKEAKDIGAECFMLDDGWFKNRKDDHRALGDWEADTKKLPHGLTSLSKKIHDYRLLFGLWVEPEMINEDSDLFRKHPTWVMKLPDREASVGRNQLMLDLSQNEVVDYLIKTLSQVFTDANADMVKWDFNRIFSDYYGKNLVHQGELIHRYIQGLHRLFTTLNDRFPKILFETCASGGHRFDCGMLCYGPQIWTSDNTDALDRTYIQSGTSMAYPPSTISAHVSAVPNHQTQRNSLLSSRMYVASFGVFGIEKNLLDASKEDKEALKLHVAWYKSVKHMMQFGSFYRIQASLNQTRWMMVNEDRSVGIGLLFQSRNRPNDKNQRFITMGLNDEIVYDVSVLPLTLSIMDFGDLINYVSPIHIRQGSFLHKLVDRFKKVSSEKEDISAYGSFLNYHGVNLKQSFTAGLSDDTRVTFDQSGRIYMFIAKK